MRVQDLVGGDIIEAAGIGGEPQSATFVGRSEHPKYPGLQLVVWRMDAGWWSFDALSPLQEVGELVSERAGNIDHLATITRPTKENQ